jgi:hypothetical protein
VTDDEQGEGAKGRRPWLLALGLVPLVGGLLLFSSFLFLSVFPFVCLLPSSEKTGKGIDSSSGGTKDGGEAQEQGGREGLPRGAGPSHWLAYFAFVFVL